MSTNLLDQVEEFFVSYNKQRKKKFQIKGLGGPKKAMKCLKVGIQSFKKARKEKNE
jgi:inorganic pyrophosphatase